LAVTIVRSAKAARTTPARKQQTQPERQGTVVGPPYRIIGRKGKKDEAVIERLAVVVLDRGRSQEKGGGLALLRALGGERRGWHAVTAA